MRGGAIAAVTAVGFQLLLRIYDRRLASSLAEPLFNPKMVDELCRDNDDRASASDEPQVIRFSELSLADLQQMAKSADFRASSTIPLSRLQKQQQQKESSSSLSDLLTTPRPLSWSEHMTAVGMLALGIPNGVFTLPALTAIVGYLMGNVKLGMQMLLAAAVPLALAPAIPFCMERLQSWPALVLLRYFSFTMIFDERPPSHCRKTNTTVDDDDDNDASTNNNNNPPPTLVAAYPHGVFPYGSLLTVLSWPTLVGHPMRGLAASAALRAPVLRQCLELLATLDASRATARQGLQEWPHTLGIAPGGVAEVFCVSAMQPTILLHERRGMIRLAIQTGADIVPAYMFGNDQLYSCWMGQGIPGGQTFLEWLSRRVVGFATVVPWGRWLLPVPYRVPLLTVIGKPIATRQYQQQITTSSKDGEKMIIDDEIIRTVQGELETAIVDLFDRYKHLYNASDQTLIVK